jgi:hypothetical protein
MQKEVIHSHLGRSDSFIRSVLILKQVIIRRFHNIKSPWSKGDPPRKPLGPGHNRAPLPNGKRLLGSRVNQRLFREGARERDQKRRSAAGPVTSGEVTTETLRDPSSQNPRRGHPGSFPKKSFFAGCSKTPRGKAPETLP